MAQELLQGRTMRSLAAAVVVLCVGCGGDDRPDDEMTGTEGPVAATSSSTGGQAGDFDRGQVVFSETCGRDVCHGPDGQAGPAPNLGVVVPQRDDGRLRSVIQLGTGNTGESAGSMPGQDLEEQDLEDVIAYLRTTFGE